MTLAPICPSPCEFCLSAGFASCKKESICKQWSGLVGVVGRKVVMGVIDAVESTGAKKQSGYLFRYRVKHTMSPLNHDSIDKLPPSPCSHVHLFGMVLQSSTEREYRPVEARRYVWFCVR